MTTRILSWLTAALILIPFAASAQGYRLKAGDILRIEVIEDEALNRSVLIDPRGRISFPQAGTMRAAGRTVGSVQSTLADRLASSFASTPNVYVSLEQVAEPRQTVQAEPEVITIYVLGEVNKPGKLTMEPGATLLQAFAEMGGFSDFAATKRVQLRRKNATTGIESVTPLNYEAMSKGMTTNATLVLSDGDVILVPTRRLFE